MPLIEETIPDALKPEAEAARAWFSKAHGSEFKLTGIVAPEQVDGRESNAAVRELQLILCGTQEGQEVCLRERFEVRPTGYGFDVVHLKDRVPESGYPTPLLDPPAGVREGWLDTVVTKHEFVVLVFYRGFWCPPCRRELLSYQKSEVVDAIRNAGGEIYAITSEPHSLAVNAQKEWQTGFEHVGDPHQEILAACHQRGWLSLIIWNYRPNFRHEVRKSFSHPKGIFQPGVLAVSRAGRVLYRWRSRPDSRNVGGSICRVTAEHVWDSVQQALEKPSDTDDAPLDHAAKLDHKGVPSPYFLLMLFASGWFLRPNYFVMAANNHPLKEIQKQMRAARWRALIFIAGWIAAFAFLPTWIPAVVLVLWIAIVAPQIYKLSKAGKHNAEFGQ